MGWPGIYSMRFSQFEGDKDFPHWMGYFLPLSVSNSIRDIEGVVYLELPFSLIGEIRLDMQDELFIANDLIFLAYEI